MLLLGRATNMKPELCADITALVFQRPRHPLSTPEAWSDSTVQAVCWTMNLSKTEYLKKSMR